MDTSMGYNNPYVHSTQITNTLQPANNGASAGKDGGFDSFGQFQEMGLPSNIMNNLQDGRVNSFGLGNSIPKYNQLQNATNPTNSFASTANPTTTNSMSTAPLFGMHAPTKKAPSNQPRIILKQANRENPVEARMKLRSQTRVPSEPETHPPSTKSRDTPIQTAGEKLAEARMDLRNQERLVLREPETHLSSSLAPNSPTRYLERTPNVRHPRAGAKLSDRLRCCMMNGFYAFWENEGPSRMSRQYFPDDKEPGTSRIAFFRNMVSYDPLPSLGNRIN